MPKGFENMRDAFIREGLTPKAAASKAAAIWNSKHPNNPVGKHKPAKRKHRARAK